MFMPFLTSKTWNAKKGDEFAVTERGAFERSNFMKAMASIEVSN